MTKALSHVISIIVVIILLNLALCQQQGESPSLKYGSNYIYLNVMADNVSGEDETTEVIMNKSLNADGSKLKYIYNIKTPPVDDFYFVLSIDSSASMKTSPKSQQASAVISAVPNFIADTINKYPNKNFNISILSWDDDIDFAYHDFKNKDPKKAKLVLIQSANEDLKQGVFEKGKFDDENYAYCCRGNESTNLSLALQASIDILKNNPVKKHHRTSKFIILVVGEGEIIDECNDSLIEEARNEGISIYAILMNPTDKSYMLDHLEKITDNKTQSCQALEGELPELLEQDLENALEAAISEPAATNVTLVESVLSCCRPSDIALININGRDFADSYQVNSENIMYGSDNNPISITFPIYKGLYPDSVTTLTFDANLVLSLPGSVNDTQPSSLKYTWLKEKDPYTIIVPSNNIKMVSFPENTQSNPPNLHKTEYSGSGLFVLTLLGFIISVVLLKFKK